MKYLLFLAITAALSSLGYWLVLTGNPAASSDPSRRIPSASPGAGIQAIGYVEPVSEIRKLMMRTGGVVKRCHVAAGAVVCKGDILLELENATQLAELEMARKQLELARAEENHVKAGVNPYRIKVTEQALERTRERIHFCELEAERYRRLLAKRAANAQEVETAETRLRQAQIELKEQEAELLHLRKHVTAEQLAVAAAKVRQAEVSMKLAEEHLRETELVAPFNGVVLKLLKHEAEGVRMFEPEPVVLFGDLSKLRVRAEVDERFVKSLAVGQSVAIYGRNLSGITYLGRVAALEHVMGKKTQFTRASSERQDLEVLQVLIDMGPDFQAPVGLQVDVRIETHRHQGGGSK